MFFTGLSKLMQEGQIINLNLMKKGGKLIVSIMPKVQNLPEQAINKLIPLNLEGTPLELDQGFLAEVSQPIQERFGLISNADAFRENTKTAVTKKTTGSTTKLTKNEQMVADAQAHEKAGRWPEAYAIYKKVAAVDPDNAKLKEKVMEVWSRMAQRPLFDSRQDEIQVENEAIVPETTTGVAEDFSMGNSDDIEESLITLAPEASSGIPEQEDTTSQAGEQSSVDMFAQLLGMANEIV